MVREDADDELDGKQREGGDVRGEYAEKRSRVVHPSMEIFDYRQTDDE